MTTAPEQRILPEIPEEVRELKGRIARFVTEKLHPFEAEIAERGEIDEDKLRALRNEAREAGFSNLNMPTEYGGMDLSMISLVALEEESGKTTNGLGYMVADRGPRELLELASPEQIERYVMPVVRGETREAWAITEPEAGSDIKDIKTTAERDGDGWVLNGEKWFVTGGERAGFFIVLAWEGEDQASFLVDRDTPGLEIVRTPTFMHDPYASKHVELRLKNCRVSEGAKLGSGGDEGTKRWFSLERLMIAARCCGAAERLLELCALLVAGAFGFWQEARGVPGHPVHARRLPDGTERRAAHDVPRRPVVGDGRSQDPSRQDGDGEAVRLRDGRPRRGPGGPDLRRSRLHDREPGRALLPRAQGRPHLGGNERDSAHHRRPRPSETWRRCVRDGRVARRTSWKYR